MIQKQRQKKAIRALEVQYKIQLERERISRDLHDNVGTQLSLISRSIQGIVLDAGNISEEDKKKKLQSTGQNSVDVINALRETIWALNKKEVSILEFFDKLKSFTQKQSAPYPETQLLFKETIGNNNLPLGPAEALNLFRICQEAITNALKYAHATLLKIEMKVQEQRYTVSITDNGIGFDKNNINTTLHYGFENMKHRAKEITCNLTINTEPNKGTTIFIIKE
jgi:signal transduction histidine kinase